MPHVLKIQSTSLMPKHIWNEFLGVFPYTCWHMHTQDFKRVIYIKKYDLFPTMNIKRKKWNLFSIHINVCVAAIGDKVRCNYGSRVSGYKTMFIASLFYYISKFYNILLWVLYFLKVLPSVYY
jgi:hypothetical protein